MKEQPRYSSFGEKAANPKGERFVQLPTRMLGRLSTALQFAYAALLKAWDDRTLTDISRKEFLVLVNAQREAAGRGHVNHERTATWYFTVFKSIEFDEVDEAGNKRVGVIARWYDKAKDAWITKSTMPVRSQFPDSPPKAAETSAPTGTPNVSAMEPAAKTDAEVREESARSVVQHMAHLKWFAPLNANGEPLLNANGEIDWKKGTTDADEPLGLWKYIRALSADIQALIARDRDSRAMIEAARPARE